MVSVVRFYCTLTGPIGGLNCEVLLLTGPIGGLNCDILPYLVLWVYIYVSGSEKRDIFGCFRKP